MEIHNLFLNLAGLSFFDADLAWLGLLILYIGPETIIPLTSFLAAIVGILLMFWRWVVGIFRRGIRFSSRVCNRLLGRKNATEDVSVPSEKTAEGSEEKETD